MADCPAPYERLGDLVHGNGALHPGGDAGFLQSILQGQRVNDGGQHAHVIARRALDSFFAPRLAAENIAPSDDNDYLHAEITDLANLARHVMDCFGRNTEPTLPAQGLTAEFKKDSS